MGSGKMVIIMYSVPYSHDFHKNWLAVGISKKEDTTGFYKTMYYKSEEEFKRKKFYKDADHVSYEEDDEYIVTGTMGSNHKPEIQVQLYPKSKSHLANSPKGENISH